MERIDIRKIIYSEIEKRLSIMDNPTYEYPARLHRSDKQIIVGALIISICLLICCMFGGFQ